MDEKYIDTTTVSIVDIDAAIGVKSVHEEEHPKDSKITYSDIVKALYESCDDIIRTLNYINCSLKAFSEIPIIQNSVRNSIVNIMEVIKLVEQDLKPKSFYTDKTFYKMSPLERADAQTLLFDGCMDKEKIDALRRIRNTISHSPFNSYNPQVIWDVVNDYVFTLYKKLYPEYVKLKLNKSRPDFLLDTLDINSSILEIEMSDHLHATEIFGGKYDSDK